MGIRESLLNTITSVGNGDFVRIVTSAGASSKATVANLFKSFESGLSAKSSLTTSDYIRVVGSDNVLYKNTISDVMSTMGVDGLMMPSNIIPSGSNVETYANGLSKGFHLACNNSSSTATAQGAPFTCPCTYYIAVYTVNEHIQIICQPWNPNVANSKTLAVKTKYGGTWSGWTIMPTRAEVDAITPTYTDVTATTTATGAFAIPTALQGKAIIDVYPTDIVAIALRRDAAYFMIKNASDMTALANISTTLRIWHY